MKFFVDTANVADIKKAGYNVSLEEIDTTKDYQIIIKLQK